MESDGQDVGERLRGGRRAVSRSNAGLGRRTYDDESEFAARWSKAEGWNSCGGNDGGKPTTIRRTHYLLALGEKESRLVPATSA